MYKVLIVDDESLARIGLQTMLVNLYGEQIEIIGAAQDGKEAISIIEQTMPDVIISDIKMPVMTGLELAKRVDENYEEKPLFIFLTSYEDFNYAREALKYRAFDYLIKMEFNREILKKVLDRAFEESDKKKKARMSVHAEPVQEMSNIFVSRFYYSLINGRYASEEQILEAALACEQDVQAVQYVTMAMRIQYPDRGKVETGHQYNLYFSILNSVKMALQMHYHCYVVAYNHEVLGCILMLDKKEEREEVWQTTGKEAGILCRQYFNVQIQTGIGKAVSSICDVGKSFQTAQLALMQAREEKREIVSYSSKAESIEERQQEVSMAEIERRVVEALEHCDAEEFGRSIDQIAGIAQESNIESAISQVSGLVHLILNCLEGGEGVLTEAFSNHNSTYQSLYSIRVSEEIQVYIQTIKKCICERLQRLSSDPKYKLVKDAKQYIGEHIYERVTLAEVAGAIGISQNYLSSLFRLYNGTGFSEYVAESKIHLAKEMLGKGDMKVYQVSERLGFDNQQYFSKVYKKYTGYSPSEKPVV